jgi:hypothetical protein
LATPRRLFDSQYLIGRNVFEGFSLAAGPTNLYRVGFFMLSETEVETLIVVRVITGLAGDFLNLQPRAGPQ